MSVTATSLLLAALLSLADGRPARPKKEFLPLQGNWKLVSVGFNGRTIDFSGRLPNWIIRGDKVLYGGEELATLTLDPSTTPRCIDLGFLSPKRVYEGVYEVSGDTLKICVNSQSDGVKERPLVFATKDKLNLRLFVFQREKDGKGDGTENLRGYVGMALRNSKDRKAVVIAEALEGSPAKRAGLKKDDVLVTVGDLKATDLRAVYERMAEGKPGDKLMVRVRRGGKVLDITVKVGVTPFFLLD
jgi:uncharacterized protein (TIGR03067 family)